MNVLERSVVRFYPVTKGGGPVSKPLLPWDPKSERDEKKSRKKLFFNIESELGVLYRVMLKRNKDLFSKLDQQMVGQDAGCLFSGHIVGDGKSSVGMNLCNGMVRLNMKSSQRIFYFKLVADDIVILGTFPKRPAS